MKDLILAIRRYLGDRAPGEPGGDIADIRAAIERAEASVAAERGLVMPSRDATQVRRTAEVTRAMVEDVSNAMKSGLLPQVASAAQGPSSTACDDQLSSQPPSPDQATA